VTLDGGKETIEYGTLVLAPGSLPRRLPVEGNDLAGVHTLRYVEDAQKIDAGRLSLFWRGHGIDRLMSIFF
jgi:apoptosis-inducing factor 3